MWVLCFCTHTSKCMGRINRFKELDLVDRVPEKLWMEAHNIVQEVATKTIPKKRKCKKVSRSRGLQQLKSDKPVQGQGYQECKANVHKSTHRMQSSVKVQSPIHSVVQGQSPKYTLEGY